MKRALLGLSIMLTGKATGTSRPLRKKKEADVRHAEVNVDVQTGVHVPASKSVTLAEAAEIWLEAAKLEGLERGTLLQYQGQLEAHSAGARSRETVRSRQRRRGNIRRRAPQGWYVASSQQTRS